MHIFKFFKVKFPCIYDPNKTPFASLKNICRRLEHALLCKRKKTYTEINLFTFFLLFSE